MLEQSVDTLEQVVNLHSSSLAEQKFKVLQQTYYSRATHSYEWRIQQLNQLQKLAEENQQEIREALFADLHKSETEAWLTEIGFIVADIKHTKKNLKSWMKATRQSTPLLAMPGSSYTKYEPLGVALVIGAWNYPFQLTLSPVVAAIAAGNCVVLKPSELAPHVSTIITKLVAKYLDNSAFAVIEGGKEETTELLTFPFDKIFYTGGEHVGKLVMAAAAKHLTPVTLELGGKSPCLVDGETNLQIAVKRIVWGKLMNLGQTCVAPDYILIEQSHNQVFVDALIKEIELQYGTCDATNKDLGRIINSRHAARLASYLDGQNVIFGGGIDVENRFVQPTIVLNPSSDSLLMSEEIFGPILPIIVVESKQQMINFVRQRPKPLAAYLFSDDSQFQQNFIDQVSSGSQCINDTSVFMVNHELPFGGVGTSGMGSYHGKAGYETFSHKKSIMKRSYKFDAVVRYAPFKSWKLRLLKWMN